MVLRIELELLSPVIWRRVVVPADITLAKLHLVLQEVMGWWNYHLHEYQFGDRRYGIIDPDWIDRLQYHGPGTDVVSRHAGNARGTS